MQELQAWMDTEEGVAASIRKFWKKLQTAKGKSRERTEHQLTLLREALREARRERLKIQRALSQSEGE